MNTIEWIARNGEAVRQAIEFGDIVHIDTANEELTDEFLLFAINSGLLEGWADTFPDPRQGAEISMQIILAASLSARFGGLCSFRKLGYVLQPAQVLGALGYSVAVTEAGQGMSRRATPTMSRWSATMYCASSWCRWNPRSRSARPSGWAKWSDTRIGHVRKRGSRRAAKGQVEAGEAQVRGRRIAEHLLKWYSPPGAGYLAVYSLKPSPFPLA